TAGFALLLLLLCTWSLSDIKDKATINKNFFEDPVDLESIGQFVYSAYFDTRPTLNGRKYVRVITVLDTKAYEKELICQFMHQSGHLSFSTVAKRSAIGAGMGHKQHYYKEFVLSCPVADDLSSATFVFIQTGDASLRSQVMRNLGRYTYTAVFDLDEIIVPQQHPDYPTLLSALEKRANTSSFAFRNWYHFSELGEDSSVDPKMYMLRHPYSTKQESPLGYSIKSIHKSCCVVALHNHFSWEDVPKPNTQSGHLPVPIDLGLNEHYKKCHFDEKTCKEMTNATLRKDGSRLLQLMGEQLTAAFQSKTKQLLG
uniref:Glycosyltransferase family 92 protein n=1 Tax=Macrostomum lignano TaxID=282301 RepID=A0A1I8J3E2_9PLAT